MVVIYKYKSLEIQLAVFFKKEKFYFKIFNWYISIYLNINISKITKKNSCHLVEKHMANKNKMIRIQISGTKFEKKISADYFHNH